MDTLFFSKKINNNNLKKLPKRYFYAQFITQLHRVIGMIFLNSLHIASLRVRLRSMLPSSGTYETLLPTNTMREGKAIIDAVHIAIAVYIYI